MTTPEVLSSLTSWYSYAGIAQCQRFIHQACMRTQRIRFTANEQFVVRTP